MHCYLQMLTVNQCSSKTSLCYRTYHLMTGPLGNQSTLFPLNLSVSNLSGCQLTKYLLTFRYTVSLQNNMPFPRCIFFPVSKQVLVHNVSNTYEKESYLHLHCCVNQIYTFPYETLYTRAFEIVVKGTEVE